MAKNEWADQYKHPNWQKKRLEALEHYGFECTNCGDKETVLHVHHRRYIKGRKVWEYDISDLDVLCEPCHESHHFLKQRFEMLFNFGNAEDLVGLIGGYMSAGCDDPGLIEECRQSGDEMSFALGLLAACLHGRRSLMRAAAESIFASGVVLHPAERRGLEDFLGGAEKD